MDDLDDFERYSGRSLNSLKPEKRDSSESFRSKKSDKSVGFGRKKSSGKEKKLSKHHSLSAREKMMRHILEDKYEVASVQKCEEDEDDAYAIDFSLLKKLPKSVILDALEYAKKKRQEEEEKEREKEEYKRLKCIPPWAKSYGGARLETCISTGTQYEEPSYLKLTAAFMADSESKEADSILGSMHGSRDSRKGRKGGHARGASTDDTREERWAAEGEEDMEELLPHEFSLEDQVITGKESYQEIAVSREDLEEKKRKSKHKKDSKKSKASEESVKALSDIEMQIESDMDKSETMLDQDLTLYPEGEHSDSKLDRGEQDLEPMTSPSTLAITSPSTLAITSKDKKESTVKLLPEDKTPQGPSLENVQRIPKPGLGDELLFEEDYLKEGLTESETDREGQEYRETLEVECEWGEEAQEIIIKATESKQKPGKDSEYLKYHLGNILPKILAEIGWKQPPDPVHYLAHRLYCERRHQQIREQMACKRAALKAEREKIATEALQEPIQTFGFIPKIRTSIEIPDMLDKFQYEDTTSDETVEEEITEEQLSDEEVFVSH